VVVESDKVPGVRKIRRACNRHGNAAGDNPGEVCKKLAVTGSRGRMSRRGAPRNAASWTRCGHERRNPGVKKGKPPKHSAKQKRAVVCDDGKGNNGYLVNQYTRRSHGQAGFQLAESLRHRTVWEPHRPKPCSIERGSSAPIRRPPRFQKANLKGARRPRQNRMSRTDKNLPRPAISH